MPVISLTRLLEIGAKLLLFSSFSYFFITSIDSFSSMLLSILQNLNASPIVAGGSSVPEFDLGCFSKQIGLVTFLNSLFILIYNAVGFYISSIMTIMSFKIVKIIYEFAFKV